MLIDYENKDFSYYDHIRPELVPYITHTPKRVLDVGCGTGNFGGMIKDLFKCEVWGIEPEKRAADEAAEKMDYVINDVYDSHLHWPEGVNFDFIFFNDVLEHMVEPEKALRLSANLLATGGSIIASIPNLRFYPAMLSLVRYKDFKYLDAGVMDRTHLRFFTQKSIARMFEECGYEIVKIEGINKHRFKYLEVLNFCLFNALSDMRYPQYAVVANKTNRFE